MQQMWGDSVTSPLKHETLYSCTLWGPEHVSKMTLATCVWKVCCWDKMRLGKTGDLIAMATHLQWHDSAVEQMTLERWVTMSIFLVLVWSNHEGVGSYLWKSCRILRILKQPLLHKYVIRNDQDDFGFLNRIIITEQPNLLAAGLRVTK